MYNPLGGSFMCCTCLLIQSNGEFKMTILTELTEFKNVKESHQLPRLKKKTQHNESIYNKYQLQEHMEVILTVKKPSGVEQEKRQSHQVKFLRQAV